MLEYFLEITKIPRASYKEEKIADYLCSFARERGLECYRDKAHNVLIKAAGSAGRESEGAVLLQGHTDMVCECDFGVEWNVDELSVREQRLSELTTELLLVLCLPYLTERVSRILRLSVSLPPARR